jgi:NADH-quinone oxidoreductase subunit M
MVYIAAVGIVITAAYHLWTIQRMFLGPFNERWAGLKDMDFREIITLAPTVVFAIVIGVMPALLLNMFTPWVSNLMKSFGG